MAEKLDTDQMIRSETSDHGQHYLQRSISEMSSTNFINVYFFDELMYLLHTFV